MVLKSEVLVNAWETRNPVRNQYLFYSNLHRWNTYNNESKSLEDAQQEHNMACSEGLPAHLSGSAHSLSRCLDHWSPCVEQCRADGADG